MTTSNGRIVLRDLAELGQFRDLVVGEPPPAAESAAHDDPLPADHGFPPGALLPDPVALVAPDEITALAATLDDALADLRAIAEADAQARARADAGLAAYRHLEDAAARLDVIVARAEEAAEHAVQLSGTALNVDGREQAAHIATTAGTLVATARARAAAARDQAGVLACRPDVARLLAEEREAAAAAEREAESRRRDEQLQEGLERVEALIAEGNENEARRMLGTLAKDHPNSPDTASLIATLDRRAQAVKTGAADQALRQARRLARHAPDEAVALLGPLDLDGVPDDLARQVYGCWLAACRRLAPAGARHYSPRFSAGAVLIPVEEGRLEVMAAIGLPEWTPGRRFSASALRGARRL